VNTTERGAEFLFASYVKSLPCLRSLPDDEERATVHAEFTKYVIQVLLHRAFCNAKGIGNLAVAHALHQQIDDLPFPLGERRLRLARCRRGRLAPIGLSSLAFAAIGYSPVAA